MAGDWHKSRTSAGLTAALAIALVLLVTPARAFPGVYVGKGDAERVAHTTHVVLMLHPEISVITVMADYQGPLSPFALVMPVPADVVVERIKTVKREFVDRVEQLSAPRFHTFYEQDPCKPGPVEQQWEARIKAQGGPGFLTPWFVPPADRGDEVPKVLSIPTEPVFKGPEGEFVYHVLSQREANELDAWLEAKGYSVSDKAREALQRYRQAGMKLLVAEVKLDNVELVGSDRVQLGGIRYWSRQPATTIGATLGLLSSAKLQDLFVYVLHPKQRYEAKNYDNVFPPTDTLIDPAAKERVAQLYNALYDRQLARKPRAFVNEFAWSTAGCGEPCPNAPLQLRELMSLGGDVLEAETVSRAARLPKPPEETEEERMMFEAELEEMELPEQLKARKQRDRDRKELARRHALLARQKYVLSRLHYRYDKSSLPEDVEVGPAEQHMRGGVGIPEKPTGHLSTKAKRATESRYQVRFVHLFAWNRSIECPNPERWRWGKRWKNLGHIWRKVWLAHDLPRQRREPDLLTKSIRTPLPELGLGVPPPAAPPPDTSDTDPPKPKSGCGCSTPASAPRSSPLLGLLLAAVVLMATRRAQRPVRYPARNHCARRSPERQRVAPEHRDASP